MTLDDGSLFLARFIFRHVREAERSNTRVWEYDTSDRITNGFLLFFYFSFIPFDSLIIFVRILIIWGIIRNPIQELISIIFIGPIDQFLNNKNHIIEIFE